jgi:hypothetical protein
MKRGRTLGGLAGLAVLGAAAVAVLVMVVLFFRSNEIPEAHSRINTADQTPLIEVEDKVITQFHLEVGRRYHRLRAGKDGFVMPDHGILRDAVNVAAWESILQKYGHGLTPQEIAEERARQIRESRDRDTMNRILGLLDPYPGMFEWMMVRPALANQRIHKLQQSRQVQAEAYAKAEEGLKEARSNPDFFRAVKERDPSMYERSDSRNPEFMPGNPDVPQPHLPPGAKNPIQERIKAFGQKKLSKLNPGDVNPEILDEDGAYLVVRLIDRGVDFYDYEAVIYRKSVYDVWFEAELRKLKGRIVDPKTRETMKEGLKDSQIMRWLESSE